MARLALLKKKSFLADLLDVWKIVTWIPFGRLRRKEGKYEIKFHKMWNEREKRHLRLGKFRFAPPPPRSRVPPDGKNTDTALSAVARQGLMLGESGPSKKKVGNHCGKVS